MRTVSLLWRQFAVRCSFLCSGVMAVAVPVSGCASDRWTDRQTGRLTRPATSSWEGFVSSTWSEGSGGISAVCRSCRTTSGCPSPVIHTQKHTNPNTLISFAGGYSWKKASKGFKGLKKWLAFKLRNNQMTALFDFLKWINVMKTCLFSFPTSWTTEFDPFVENWFNIRDDIHSICIKYITLLNHIQSNDRIHIIQCWISCKRLKTLRNVFTTNAPVVLISR